MTSGEWRHEQWQVVSGKWRVGQEWLPDDERASSCAGNSDYVEAASRRGNRALFGQPVQRNLCCRSGNAECRLSFVRAEMVAARCGQVLNVVPCFRRSSFRFHARKVTFFVTLCH